MDDSGVKLLPPREDVKQWVFQDLQYILGENLTTIVLKKISLITKYQQIIPRLLKNLCSFVGISKLNLKHVFVLKWIVLQWTCEPANLLTCGPVDLWTCGPVDLWICGSVDLWACGSDKS